MSSRLHLSNSAPRDEGDELLREYPSPADDLDQVLHVFKSLSNDLKKERDHYGILFNTTSKSQTLDDEQYQKLTKALRRLLKHYADLFGMRALPVAQRSPQKFPMEDNLFRKMCDTIEETLELLQKNGSGAFEHLSLAVQIAHETMGVLKETAPKLSSDWSHLDKLLQNYRHGATDEVQSASRL